MKQYEVTITETLERKVKVPANNPTEAEAKVKEMYDKSEVILDADDFTGLTEYSVEEADDES